MNTHYMTQPGVPPAMSFRRGTVPKPAVQLDPEHLASHERVFTQAQIVSMMRDFHQLRSERDRTLAEQTRALQENMFRFGLIGALNRAEDGRRVLRIGAMSALLARSVGCPQSWCEKMYLAAPLHDVGLVQHDGSPRLRGTDQVSPEHALLGSSQEPVMRMALQIAASWQEHWDGHGQPDGLAFDSIPVAGRVVALVRFLDDMPGFRLNRRTAGRPLQPAQSQAQQPVPSVQTDQQAAALPRQYAWTDEIVSNDELAARLKIHSGRRFDPNFMQHLIRLLPAMRQIRTLVDRQYKGFAAPDWGTSWWSAFHDDSDSLLSADGDAGQQAQGDNR